jgi:allantoinase
MPDFDLIIKGGNIVTPEGVQRADVAVSGERIVAIAPQIHQSATETIDATGLHIFPGLIDVHVHFNDPGRADWEGACTGSSALAAGGGTCFFDMPLNSSPPVLDAASFDAKLNALTGRSYTDFAIWGGLTPQSRDNMKTLAQKGVVGFKAFMCDSGIDDFQRADDWTLYYGMLGAARLGLPVAVHAENQELTAGRTKYIRQKKKNKPTVKDWSNARFPLAEAEAIQRAIYLAEHTGVKLHIVHISCRLNAEFAAARRGKANLSLETCPHFYLLDGDDVTRIGPTAKCAPPIRYSASINRIWDSVVQGTIDVVASDHSPSPLSMKKESDFFSSWGGIAGVQSTLPSLFVLEPAIPLQRVAQLIAGTPARRFGIPNKGQIAANFDADFALIDLSAEYTLTREMLLDRHKLSPYVGRNFRGKIVRTVLRGHTIFQDGKITGEPRGQFIRPALTGSEGQTNV